MPDIEMIDDAFWLKYAKDHVVNAVKSRDDAAGKLDSYLGVVWPIYTAAFALGTAFNVIDNTISVSTVIILAMPILLIPIARFLCTWVQLPVFTEFFPNDPDSIEQDLYAHIIENKSKRLNWATGFAIFCGLSIGVALFAFKIYSIPKSNYEINVVAVKQDKKLRVDGIFPAKKSLNMIITGADSLNNYSLIIMPPLTSNDKGRVDTVIDSKLIEKNIKVFATWVEDKKNVTISSK